MRSAVNGTYQRVCNLDDATRNGKRLPTVNVRKPLYPEHADWYDGPEVTYDESGKPIKWHITLNEYQRANLLWLLCDVIGYGTPYIEPFHLANTGDWAGEIPNMLRRDHREPTEHRPNLPADELRRNVEHWLKHHK